MSDITQNYALSEIQLVAINKSSEGMNVPVYHVNGITKEFLQDHYNDNVILNFGNSGDDCLYLAGGFVRESLNQVAKVLNDKIEGNTTIDIKVFSDGTKLEYYNSFTSPDIAGSQLRSNGSKGQYIFVTAASLPLTTSDEWGTYSISGNYVCLLRYNDNGVNKYVPIKFSVRPIASPLSTSSKWAAQVNIYLSSAIQYKRNFQYIGLGDMTASNILDFTADDIKGTIEEEPGPPLNPYEPGGPSEEGILPPGTFDDTSDSIPDSSLPTLSAANTGFTRIYNPTLSQVQDLARYLWTDETVIQTIWNHIKQYFEDPMQAIIGFNLVPCAVPDAGSQSFALMYIDTGVQMNVAANQFVDVDCGSVKLERYYGSALDQSPYTRVSCFLPFIGTVRLNTDEVMGSTLQVKYRIDICSGSCVAKILVDGNVIYQYSGHCAINIPISSADFSSYVQATMSIAKLAVGAAVGGAMGAMAATSAEPSQQTNRAVTTTRTETSTERNPATGRQVTAGTSTVTTREESHSETSTKASFDYLTPSNIANTVGQVMSSKPIVEHTGSFSGNSGYLGIRRPFLIIERPNMCLPEKYQQFNGYPSMITMRLGSCKGYTRLQQVQLTGMTATNPEQAELMGLLKSGVIF